MLWHVSVFASLKPKSIPQSAQISGCLSITHLGNCKFFVTVNKALVKVLGFLDSVPRSGVPGPYGDSIFNSLRNTMLFSTAAVPCYIPSCSQEFWLPYQPSLLCLFVCLFWTSNNVYLKTFIGIHDFTTY